MPTGTTASPFLKTPLVFEANQGQTDKQVKYLCRGADYQLFLTGTDAVFALRQPTEGSSSAPPRHKRAISATAAEMAVLRMSLVGASQAPRVTGEGLLPGKAHYLQGSDPKQWHTDVPLYTKIRYANVYPGTDLVYYGAEGRLEFDFVVAPQRDHRNIALQFANADSIALNNGRLTLRVGAGVVAQYVPGAYQEENGRRRPVDVRPVLKGPNRSQVGFELGAYDHNKPVVIDPVLVYSTYAGGGGEDRAQDLHVDGNGSVYVTGASASANFPTTLTSYRGGYDAFVTKLDPAGNLVYSTYLGGGGDDGGEGVAWDSAGNVYVSGWTYSGDFPTINAFQPGSGGGEDVFVTKLAPSGSALLFSTYLGGGGDDRSYNTVIGADGGIYLAGYTRSTNFPVTAGTLQPASGGGKDAFVTKLSASGNTLVYSTYLGGAGDEDGWCLGVDPAGYAYTGGPTASVNFPTTANAFQPGYGGGGCDVFMSKLNTSGTGLVYSTYLGGSGQDYAGCLRVDSAGNAYMAGGGDSSNYPTRNAFQNTFAGSYDVVVTKLGPSGNLVYSTYLGGGGWDGADSIDVDAAGAVYVTGWEGSGDFPVTSGALQPANGGGYDAFVTKIGPNGNTVPYSTFLGGNSYDNGRSLRLDSRGGLYVTGYTYSGNFPTNSAFQAAYSGAADAFIVKFSTGDVGVTAPCDASALAGLSLNPANVIGGNPSTGTVTLAAPAIAGGQVVALASANLALASVPSTVLVPAGQISAYFSIATQPVSTLTSVVLSASYHGGTTQTATLTLTPLSGTEGSGGGGAAPNSVTTATARTANITNAKSTAATSRRPARPQPRPGRLNRTDRVSRPLRREQLIPLAALQASFGARRSSSSGVPAARVTEAVRAALAGATARTASMAGGSDILVPGQCGPMDVVFVIDDSGSMGGAIQNIRNGLKTILGDIETASAGDYRLALVSFRALPLVVHEPLAARNFAAFTAKLNQLSAGGGAQDEPSDQALSTVVNALPARAGLQEGNFAPFRPNARKIVILVGDEYPGGPDEVYTAGTDDVFVQKLADLAASKGIQISVVQVAQADNYNGYNLGDTVPEDLARIWIGTATTTGGQFDITPGNGTGADIAIDATIRRCGGYGTSQIIYTRDDRTLPHDPFTITGPATLGASPKAATFDLSGVALGTVTSAHMARRGRLQRTANSAFDLEWGIQSTSTPILSSWGAAVVSANALPDNAPYGVGWFLPDRSASSTASLLGEIEAARGLWYTLSLVDRVSSTCGPYAVSDTPQANAPGERNTLTFLVAPFKAIQVPKRTTPSYGGGSAPPPYEFIQVPGRPEIPQGGALDITIPGTDRPEYGTWEIRQGGSVIASSGNPSGWNVTFDETVYRGVWVNAPADAPLADDYQVRFAGTDAAGTPVAGSGAFEVTGPTLGTGGGAAILLGLSFAPNPVVGGNTTTGTLVLSAPAPVGGAAVALTSANPNVVSVPAQVIVPRGQSQATFAATTAALSGTDPAPVVLVRAGYNGVRTAPVTVLRTNGSGLGSIGPPTLTATGGNQTVDLSWTAASVGAGRGPVRYNLKRSQTKGGPYDLLFSGLDGLTFRDTSVRNGVTYFYVVAGVDGYGEGAPSNEASVTPWGGKVATPVIDPPGGTISVYSGYNGNQITLSCATRGAIIRYTVDGSDPTESSPIYVAPFTPRLPSGTTRFTLKARGFKIGWQPSDVAAAVFTVSGPSATNVVCSQFLGGVLEPGDDTSLVKGTGFLGDRYQITLLPNQSVTIRLKSTDFNTYLTLLDGTAPVAQNDDANGSTNSEVSYTYATGGGYAYPKTFTIEVTSATAGATGRYSLEIACSPIGGNQAPTVQIVKPDPNSTFPAGQPIPIEARASDPDGTVARVEFFAGAQKLGESSVGSPFSFLWADPPAGVHDLRAVAFDSPNTGQGLAATSVPVTITVLGSDGSTPLACGQTTEGELTLSDPTSDVVTNGTHYRDRYTFTATAGQKILLTLKSGEFDTLLLLRQPDGSFLANDNEYDNNLSTNSRLIYTIPQGGTYTIEVTSSPAGQTGVYQLTLACPSGAIAPAIKVFSEEKDASSGAAVWQERNPGDAVPFGTTATGVGVNKRFRVRNDGLLDLFVTGLSLTAGDFRFAQLPQNQVPPGGETTFVVRFNASAPGTSNPTLTLRSTAPTPRDVFPLNLSGTATNSTLTLTGLSLNPSSVNAGQGATGTVTLSGAAPRGGFAVTVRSDNAAAVPDASVVVPEGASSQTFAIGTVTVQQTTTATITAAAPGSTDKTAPLTINAAQPAGTPPQVWLSVPGSPFTAPADIAMTATATAGQAGASIVKVEFLSGASKIGEGARQNNTNDWTFTWTGVEAGTYTLKARATDSGGRSATSNDVSVTVNARAQVGAPTIQIQGQPAATTFSGSAIIEIVGTTPDATYFYTLDGSEPTPRSLRYAGPFEIGATITVKARGYKDGLDPSTVASRTFTRTDAGSNLDHSVRITAPASSDSQTTPVVITGPVAIQGQVGSGSPYGGGAATGQWRLAYRLVGEDNWVPLASGKAPIGSGQTLATFDPTLLLNGAYEIGLEATFSDGQTRSAIISVTVEGNLKVGHFTFSVVDMTVPVAGLPIQVVRTYDSRDKRAGGDFGTGWTLSLTNVRSQKLGAGEDNKIGRTWTVRTQGLNKTATPSGARALVVTLPDGQVLAWAPVVQMYPLQAFGQVNWVPATRAARRAELLPDDGGGQVYHAGGTSDLMTLDENDDPAGVYDIDGFAIRLRNGTRVEVDASGTIQRIIDRSGNRTEFSSGAIATYAPDVAAPLKTVTIQRGANNRVNAIIDPRGNRVSYQYGANNLLSGVTNRVGATTRYGYDYRGNLTTIITPSGKVPVRNVYQPDGRMAASRDAFGRSVDYAYNLNTNGTGSVTIADRKNKSNPTQVQFDRYGNVSNTNQFVSRYNANGSVADTDYVSSRAAYGDGNNPELPTATTDPLNRSTTYTYSPYGDLQTARDAKGRVTEYQHNGFGDVTKVIGPDLKVLSDTQYDIQGNPIVQRDALGKETRTTYTGGGQPRSVTDAEGGTTEFAYDRAGNQTAVKDAQGGVTEFAYDANGNRTGTLRRRTRPNGTTETAVTQTIYDGEDRPIATISATGGRSDTSYNADGQVEATRDAQGRVTRYEYDAQGQRIGTVSPDGTSTRTEYDENGRAFRSVSRDGSKSETQFDEAGRAVFTRQYSANGALLSTNQTVYDAAGQVTESRDARGSTTFRYDENGNQIEVAGATPRVTTAYDAYNRPLTITDALNRTTTSVYDPAGRVIEVRYPDGTSTQTGYDGVGRRTSETNENGDTTSFGYDKAGRLTSVIDALGRPTTYGYDEVGNRISQTDANGHTTGFNYDAGGRLVGKKLPGGQIYTWNYLANGRLDSTLDWSDPSGATPGYQTNYQYDPLGRLTGKGSGAQSVTFDYDSLGRRYKSWRNGASLVQRAFDPATGRLQGLATPQGNLSYGYEGDGSRQSVQTPTGTSQYQYDAAGRLSRHVHKGGLAANDYTEYHYDDAGQLEWLQRPNGTYTRYSYDLRGRVLRVQHDNGNVMSPLLSYTYTYDAAGRRTSITEGGTNASAPAIGYEYDKVGRLTKEMYSTGRAIIYGYDNVGNRTGKTDSADPQFGGAASTYTYEYDANDRLGRVLRNGSPHKEYGYDNAGRVTGVTNQSNVTTGLTWTFDERLASVGSVQFAYDGDGNRIGKAGGAQGNVAYLVDPTTPYAQVVEESKGGQTSRYDFGLDVARIDRGSGVYYYFYDALGSVRALSSGANGSSLVDALSYGFDAFGRPSGGVPGASTGQSFALNGQQFDSETGLYYLRARYYDPEVGRFLSQDPFGGATSDPATLHRYFYAGQNPTSLSDPSGQFTIGQVAVASFIGISLAATSVGVFDPSPANAPVPGGPILKDDPINHIATIITAEIGGRAVTYVIGRIFNRLISPAVKSAIIRSEATEDSLRAIEGSGVGTVIRNELDDVEYAFAEEIAGFKGGTIVGPPAKSFPGIDGWLDAGQTQPLSLKVLSSGSAARVANAARVAEEKALKNGYKSVEVYISAKNVAMRDLLTYNPTRGSGNALVNIPKQGTVKAITVLTKDGWVRFIQ